MRSCVFECEIEFCFARGSFYVEIQNQGSQTYIFHPTAPTRVERAAGDNTYRIHYSIDSVALAAFYAAYTNTMTNTSSDLETVDVS